METNRPAASVPQLPKSVWRCIASFLPLSTIKTQQLYTVNRAFLEYYLKYKYHTSLLDYDERLGHFIFLHGRAVSLPLFAAAVKTLKLKLTENVAMTNIFTDLIRLIPARLWYSPKRRPSAVFEGLPKQLRLMENLTAIEYTIASRNVVPILDFNKLFPLGLSNAWKASSESLTRLSLTLNMVSLPRLDLAGLSFPLLREFAFCFSPKGCVGKSRPRKLKRSIHADLIPFICRHRESLTTLSLSFLSQSHDLAHHFLSSLPMLPSLRILAIDLKLSRRISTSGLHTFLQSHSKQIEGLELQLGMESLDCKLIPTHGRTGCQCLAQWWKSQPFMGIVFPRLARLRCYFEGYDDYELLLQYLARVASRVRVLDLRPRSQSHIPACLGYEHLDALTLIYYQNVNFNRLERLYMECTVLAPEVLKLLATRLPHLKFLYMSFWEVTLIQPEPPLLGTLVRDPVSRAYRVFASAPYHQWELRSLVLEDEVHSHPSHEPALCKAAMKMALPNLKLLKYLRQGTLLSE